MLDNDGLALVINDQMKPGIEFQIYFRTSGDELEEVIFHNDDKVSSIAQNLIYFSFKDGEDNKKLLLNMRDFESMEVCE